MNKDLFLKVIINDQVLKRIIFNNVYQINKLINISKRSQPNDHRDKRYRWNDLIESPIALSGNGYLHLLKQYYNKYPLSSNDVKCDSVKNNISTVCFAAILNGGLDIIKFLMEEKYVSLQDSKDNLTMQNLIYLASKHKKPDIFHYLLVEYKCDTFKWDYRYPFSVSPLTGCLETVKLASQLCPETIDYVYHHSPSALDNAASIGNLEIIEWLKCNRPQNEVKVHRMYYNAAMSGHVNVFEYIIKHNLLPSFDEPSPHFYLLDFAVQGNHLELAKYIHSNPILSRYVSNNIYNYAYNTSVEMIQWLHTNRTAESCTTDLMDMAAFHGRLDIIQWLHQNNTTATCTHKAMDNAACNGFLDLVKWLHFNRTEGCTTNAMDRYTVSDDFEIIKWLHVNRTEGCTPLAMDFAATNGNFELVKWLHDNRTEECTRSAIIGAITYGHYHIAKWLFENESECFNNPHTMRNFLPLRAIDEIMRKDYSMANFEILRWILEISPLESIKIVRNKTPPSQRDVLGKYWEIINQSITDREKLSPATKTKNKKNK